ncbi:hypothetical protein KJ693_08980 [bacterium]|nr:hypothetical protein [bacterium]
MKEKKTIPHFKSEEEEARWYQKHKSELDGYFEEMDQTETPEISWELRRKILDKTMTDRKVDFPSHVDYQEKLLKRA